MYVNEHFRGRPFTVSASLVFFIFEPVQEVAIPRVGCGRHALASCRYFSFHLLARGSPALSPLADQHTIAITVEPVVRFYRMTVSGQDILFTCKRCHQRQKR